MSLVGRLTEKPWLTPGLSPEEARVAEPGAGRSCPATMGLRLYLAVVSALFLLISAAYLLRMGDQAPGTVDTAWILPFDPWVLASLCGVPPSLDWTPMPEPWLLWANTLVLGLCSVAWEWARAGIRSGHGGRLTDGLVTAGVFGLAFLAGQGTIWRHLMEAGYAVSAGPANAFFYMITILHAVHILGGLVVWAMAAGKVMAADDMARADSNGGLEIVFKPLGGLIDRCAFYWHFLFLVWLLMFALLLST